jgi:hypothetical protein
MRGERHFLTYDGVYREMMGFIESNMTVATIGTGTDYSSGASEFTSENQKSSLS